MNRVDFLETNLARQLTWIQAADSRIALVLPLSTAMLGVLAALAPDPSAWKVFPSIASSFAAVFLILSIAFSACAAFPRTKGPKGSLVFFSGIVSRNESQFADDVTSLDEGKYLVDLIAQVHINAQIADKKFSWVKRAMGSLFLSSFPWAIAVYALYRG